MFFPRIFAILLALAGCLRAEGEIRVAVLAENEPDLEALVQTKLGERKNLILLARTELPVLERESLAAGGALRLAGVDRLVVLSKTDDGPAVRVTDCSTGAVVYEANLPPGLDVNGIAEMLALRLPSQFERSPREDARRIALLGFRFPVSSSENRALESRLNLACAVALQSSGDAVVLERWRMKDLVFENTLRADAIGTFWNSAVMVQGAISQESDRLSVTLEIKSPGAEARLERVEGRASDLPQLGARLAAAILKTPATPPVSARAEAEAYLAEMDWLLAHRLLTEAVQAAESAVALDPGNQAAEIRRIKAYAMNAYPDDLQYRQANAVNGHGGTIKKENVGRAVAMAGEMSRLVEDYFAKYPALNTDILEDPVNLGIRTLTTSLRTLTAAYEYDFHFSDPESVEVLRASVERVGRLLREKSEGIFRSNANHLLTIYAGYWCPTPEATLAEYRVYLGRDFPSDFWKSWPEALRIHLTAASGQNPPLLDVDAKNRRAIRPEKTLCRLVAWKPEDEKRLPDLWESFLREWADSEDLLRQADALYFRWGSQVGFANREKALGPILDFLEKHPDALFGKDGRATAQMLAAPLRGLSYVRDGSLCVRYVNVLVQLFERDARLPYEMIQYLPHSFGYRRNDPALPAELGPLVQAMERHLAATESGKDISYTNMLKYALNGLRGVAAKAAPERQTSPEATGAPLKVTRLWPALRHLKKGAHLLNASGVMTGGSLWFAQDKPLAFWKIDPETFKAEFFDSPAPLPQFVGTQGGCLFVVRDDKIFIFASRDIWSFDLRSKRWRAFGLPAAQYFLYPANGVLWAAFGSGSISRNEQGDEQGTGVYRLDPTNHAADLIFSTRRRPIEHPLDAMETAVPRVLFSGTNGQPVAGFVAGEWKVASLKDGSPSTLVNPKSLLAYSFRPEGAIVAQHPSNPEAGGSPALIESVLSVDSHGRVEWLLSDPERTASGQRPVWNLPKSLSARPAIGDRSYSFVLLGNRFIVFMADTVGSTEDYTSASEMFVFERGRPDPVRIPLRFEIPAEAAPDLVGRSDFTKKAANPRPWFNSFLGSEKGFVFTGGWGFWFLPMADFERALDGEGKETVAQ